MADARTEYRSSFRKLRAGIGDTSAPSVSYPQPGRRMRPQAMSQAEGLMVTGGGGGEAGAYNYLGAQKPAAATMPPMPASASTGFAPYFKVWESLPSAVKTPISEQYGAGGFEGVAKMEGWYELPEHVRRMILEGVRG